MAGTAVAAQSGLVQEGLLHFGLCRRLLETPVREFCWPFPGVKAGIPSPGFHCPAQLPELPAVAGLPSLSHLHGISSIRSLKGLGAWPDLREDRAAALPVPLCAWWGFGGFPRDRRESPGCGDGMVGAGVSQQL